MEEAGIDIDSLYLEGVQKESMVVAEHDIIGKPELEEHHDWGRHN